MWQRSMILTVNCDRKFYTNSRENSISNSGKGPIQPYNTILIAPKKLVQNTL